MMKKRSADIDAIMKRVSAPQGSEVVLLEINLHLFLCHSHVACITPAVQGIRIPRAEGAKGLAQTVCAFFFSRCFERFGFNDGL